MIQAMQELKGLLLLAIKHGHVWVPLRVLDDGWRLQGNPFQIRLLSLTLEESVDDVLGAFLPESPDRNECHENEYRLVYRNCERAHLALLPGASSVLLHSPPHQQVLQVLVARTRMLFDERFDHLEAVCEQQHSSQGRRV